jgi:hypothetical protein
MERIISRHIAVALLLTGVHALSACSNGDQGPLGSVTSSSASMDSRKFWDRCNNGECPPMDSEDKPQKQRTQ